MPTNSLKLTEALGFSQNVDKSCQQWIFIPRKKWEQDHVKWVFLKSLQTKGQVLADASVFYSKYNLNKEHEQSVHIFPKLGLNWGCMQEKWFSQKRFKKCAKLVLLASSNVGSSYFVLTKLFWKNVMVENFGPDEIFFLCHQITQNDTFGGPPKLSRQQF